MDRLMLRHLKSMIDKDIIPEDHLLVHLCNLQDLERVCEVGVFGGNLTKRVLQKCPTIKEYYAVDPWKVYIESYNRPPHAREKSQEWWETIYQKVVVIKGLFGNKLRIMRTTSVETPKFLLHQMFRDDKKFDVVYIDAIHDAGNLCNDIRAWLPLIKDYGVISGHDYIKLYKDMILFMDDLFGEDLNLWIVDKSKSKHAFRNTAQGGNWWVNLSPSLKSRIMRDIKTKYSDLLFEGNKIE